MLGTEELFILSLLKRTVEISLYWSINKQSLNTPFIGRRAMTTHYTYQLAHQDCCIWYCYKCTDGGLGKRWSSKRSREFNPKIYWHSLSEICIKLWVSWLTGVTVGEKLSEVSFNTSSKMTNPVSIGFSFIINKTMWGYVFVLFVPKQLVLQ